MATKRKGRAPKGRAGVVILKPAGPHWYRLQWVDPDDPTGKRRPRKAVPRHLKTAADREKFRADFEKKLDARRVDLGRGAARATGTSIRDAADRYFAQADLEDEVSYRLPIDDLVAWMERAGVTSCDDLDAATLWRWREHVVTDTRKNGERRALATVDTRLRKAKTALIYMHRAKLLPTVSRDEIAEACAKLTTKGSKKKGGKERAPAPKPKPILKPHELRDLFAALDRYDADTYGETDRKGTPGRARRVEPLAPFYAFALLSGLRKEELLGLTWSRVELRGDGALDVDEEIAKGGIARMVHLDKMPTARKILAARKLQTGGKGHVWLFKPDEIKFGQLRTKYGAPEHFDLKALRRTTSTYLTNAPGIYGGASVYASAEQLGHGYDTAKKHYLHRVRNIDPEARTLEAALEITDELAHVVEAMQRRRPKKRTA